jgi:hypothetical protein
VPTLDEVYRKFGETSEAAQLLETGLGTMLLRIGCVEADLIDNPDSKKATEIYNRLNKHTLGQLIKKLGQKADGVKKLESLLGEALDVRNYLAHSFYLKQNFRRNSKEGCAVMLEDLDRIHEILLEAYKAVMLLSGIDLEKLVVEQGNTPEPAGHLPL